MINEYSFNDSNGKIRNLIIDSHNFIGAGCFGKTYRIDDKCVKLYNSIPVTSLN